MKYLALFAVLLLAGCSWFPPHGDVLSGPAPFDDMVGREFGRGGGYLVGISAERRADPDRAHLREQAILSSIAAETRPHVPAAADPRPATRPDLNDDGFLTLDEVVTASRHNAAPAEYAAALHAGGFTTAVTPPQRRWLLSAGVSPTLIDALAARP